MPGVAAAGLLNFVMGLSFFITRALLGSPNETVIGQMMITQAQKLFNLRLAGAPAALLLAVTLITIASYDRLFGMSALSGNGAVAKRGGIFGAIGGVIIESRAASHAANEISRIARAEGKLHICATGPLTNLALALL